MKLFYHKKKNVVFNLNHANKVKKIKMEWDCIKHVNKTTSLSQELVHMQRRGRSLGSGHNWQTIFLYDI